MNGRYILDGDGKPVEEEDLLKWAEWLGTAERRIAKDDFDDVNVSTVFLGLDHRHSSEGDPILYETMIFDGKHDGYQERYSTKEEALIGHETACNLVRND